MDIILKAKDVNFMDMITYPDINIEKSKTTFITGSSGSGKSTLLKLLCGAVSPKSGVVSYMGNDITSLDTVMLRREVLLCSQSVFLFDSSIRENFREFYSYREMAAPGDGLIHRYLKICCIDFAPDDDVTRMSGGERQRVFISICLSLMPKVLMLDEPTSALDSHTSDALMQSLCAFAKDSGITLIVISHDRQLCEKYSQCEIRLEGRRL